MIKHTVSESMFLSALLKMQKLDLITIYESANGIIRNTTLERNVLKYASIDFKTCARLKFGNIYATGLEICVKFLMRELIPLKEIPINGLTFPYIAKKVWI